MLVGHTSSTEGSDGVCGDSCLPRRTFKLKQVHESLNKASDLKLRKGAFKECGYYALLMISVVSVMTNTLGYSGESLNYSNNLLARDQKALSNRVLFM